MDALDVSRSTVERVRTRCVEEGPDAALRPRPSGQVRLRKLDGAQEAHLIAVACSPAPQGRKRWTLRLLADKLVELDIVDTVSYETVRRTLKKTRAANFPGGGGVQPWPDRWPGHAETGAGERVLPGVE